MNDLTAPPIHPNHLPLPWELDRHWLHRLDVEERLCRDWFYLSPTERQMLETARRVAAEYDAQGMLNQTSTRGSVIKSLVRQINNTWLAAGKARGIAMKHAVTILERYADYCAWASKFTLEPNDTRDLFWTHIVYWLNPESDPTEQRHRGPGILEMKLQVIGTRLGRMGEHRHGAIALCFAECPFVRAWTPDEAINPVSVIDRSKTIQAERKHRTGLLHWMAQSVREAIIGAGGGMPIVAPEHLGCNLPEGTDHLGMISLTNPTADEVLAILDLVSMFAYQQRSPRGSQYQIRFEVAPDLTAASVHCFKTERWLSRNKLPPLTPSP